MASDILPICPGHALVISEVHVKCLSDLAPEIASATGEAMAKVVNTHERLSSRIQYTLSLDHADEGVRKSINKTPLNVPMWSVIRSTHMLSHSMHTCMCAGQGEV